MQAIEPAFQKTGIELYVSEEHKALHGEAHRHAHERCNAEHRHRPRPSMPVSSAMVGCGGFALVLQFGRIATLNLDVRLSRVDRPPIVELRSDRLKKNRLASAKEAKSRDREGAMRLIRWMAVCGFAVAAAGCSIRPLPEDVTGYDTVQIVSKVRCEVRDALRSYVTGALARPERAGRYARLVETLEHPDFDWRELRAEFKRHRLDADTFAVFERYNGGAIAYEFTLNINEVNGNSVGFDFLENITRGTVKLGLNASNNLTRVNNRTFRIVDNFEILATLVPKRYCEPSANFPIHANRDRRNYLYPITGSLKLWELVGSFLNLNQAGNLVGIEKGEDFIPTLGDSIEFTTKFTAGATPSIELAPIVNRFTLTKANLTNSNSREDVHKLRIILKLPPEGPIAPRTIAEQRVFAGVGRPSGRTAVARSIQALALEDLASRPDRELVEATIRLREQRSRGAILD